MAMDTEQEGVEGAEGVEMVKENIVRALPLRTCWLARGALASCALFVLALLADEALPEPRSSLHTPPHHFAADTAYQHLLNLTDIGPRVAGSYENEVLAVGVIVSALKEMQRAAAPPAHNRLEIDVFTADGAFPLAFLDGMNNVYRGVSSVVARVSGRGARAGSKRHALLFNCHYDTVPDSPGASDDGAGCAVLLETARALAAARRPLRHDAVFLFNGAEENILQASHGFITQHAWARSVRAFLNVEACGAGGREVLFQAGPHAPWLLDAYADAAPRPFASSLAQEIFRSGLIPADTDFRIFRDFGNLSGLDLAWSADGYVYHTRLDAPARVPPAALQRTGDNVLALAHELVWSERLADSSAKSERAWEPVFFDVLGVWAVTVRAPTAAALALCTLALVACDLKRAADHARSDLYMSGRAWCGEVSGAGGAVLAASVAGVASAVAVALLLAAADTRLAFYSRPWLLAPLYALPAVGVSWSVLRALLARRVRVPGWWRARAVHGACAALCAAALCTCLVLRLRSGFVPLVAASGPSAAHALCGRRTPGERRAALGALGALPGALLAAYLSAGALRMLVPLAGRCGAGALPADAALGALVGALALAGSAWLLPLVAAARGAGWVPRAALGACCAAVVFALARCGEGAGTYSALTPQRLMVFHTRRTEHARLTHAPLRTDHFYWIPDLDDNTRRSLQELGRAGGALAPLADARAVEGAECTRWVWCGAPYYLPVRSLVSRSHAAPAAPRHPPRVRLQANITRDQVSERRVVVSLAAGGAQHVVVVVACAPQVAVVAAPPLADAPLQAPRWGRRRVYLFALHDARSRSVPRLTLHLQVEEGAPPPAAGEEWAALSVSAHALFGPDKVAQQHASMLAALPAWLASTGWGVDLHLYSL